jgi:Tfp pilus assembly protein PilX
MKSTRCHASQSGMVLLLCLIFLTALTLVGLSASADTILQNQLVANFKEAERAKQSALAALSWAENWLLELDGPVPEYCKKPCSGLDVHSPGELPPHPEFESFLWWQNQGYEAGIDPLTGNPDKEIIAGNVKKPIWLIEELYTIPPSDDGSRNLQVWYRILARGNGQTNAVVSVIESIVVRSWPPSDNPALPDPGATKICTGFKSATRCGRVSWRELR